jgi:hypothetical protein
LALGTAELLQLPLITIDAFHFRNSLFSHTQCTVLLQLAFRLFNHRLRLNQHLHLSLRRLQLLVQRILLISVGSCSKLI